MGPLDWVGAIAALLMIAAATEAFRAKTRRPFVEAFVASKGWTLKSCRYKFIAASPKHLTSYEVEVVDEKGHELSGIAHASGFLRRKAWIDW